MARAAAQHDALVVERADAARAHVLHVRQVGTRVHAARAIQSWLRRCRIRRLGRTPVAAPPPAPVVATAARPSVVTASPPRAPASVGAVARIAQRVAEKLSVDPVSSASSTLLQHLCIDFADFDTAAAAVQDRALLAAAQTLLTAVTVAASKLDSAGYGTLLQGDGMQDALSPQLRPTLARSARTLLAALLIADFKEDILGVQTPHARDHAAAAAEEVRPPPSVARDAVAGVTDRLHAAAVRVIGALAQLLMASNTASAVVLRASVSASMPDGNLDTSAFVPPRLRAALAHGADEHAAIRLHFIATFVHAWVLYMDAFMSWKTGDGARIAQSLTRPFRTLLHKMAAYDREAASAIGAGDAGLSELRAGTAEHVDELRRQVVSLIGSKGAVQWEKEQRAAVDMEAHVMMESPALGPTAAPALAARLPAGTPPRRGFGSPALPSHTATPASPPRDMSVPPGAATAPRAALFRDVVRNVELAHELLLSPDFRFPAPSPPDDLVDAMRSGGGASQSASVATPQAILRSLITVARPSPGFTPSMALPAASSATGPADGFSLGPAALPPSVAAAEESSPADRAPLKQSVRFWSMLLVSARNVAAARTARPGEALVDVDALVSVVRACRDCILEFYAHAMERRAQVEEEVDVDHIQQMVTARAFSHADWLAMIRNIVNALMMLEAPARNESTRDWIAAFDAFVSDRAAAFAAAKLAGAAEEHTRLDSFLLSILPVAAAFVHWKAAQIRVDMANAHVATLAPYLAANGHGAEYERRHFAETAVTRGAGAHTGTRQWLQQSMPASISAATADSDVARLATVRDGIVQQLMPLDVPYTALMAAAQGDDGCARVPGAGGSVRVVAIPLTLALDGRRITQWQNALQVIALTSTLSMMAQQYVAELPSATGAAAESLDANWPPASDCTGLPMLQQHVYTCLIDDSITLQGLRVCLLSDVRAWSAHLGRTLPASPEAFTQAVERAVATQHPLYAVMQRRALDVVRRRVTQALHARFGGEAAAAAASSHADMWGVLLAEPLPAALAAAVPACAADAVTTMAQAVARLVTHNVAVHLGTYRQLMRELVAARGAGTAAA